MNAKYTIPQDLTGVGGGDFEREILPLLEILAKAPTPQPARRVQAVILDRTLTLLRSASRSEIDEDAYALELFLAAHGKALRGRGDQGHEVYAGLSAIASLLAAAADRSDALAVESILRNHRGCGREVMEILADHGSPMPHADLVRRLS